MGMARTTADAQTHAAWITVSLCPRPCVIIFVTDKQSVIMWDAKKAD